uniref:Uncharacterized protein n=1 Tax=Seriola lalandi dorsalis TaxID=1841481 RepID=A0A3B4X8W5_SERLL
MCPKSKRTEEGRRGQRSAASLPAHSASVHRLQIPGEGNYWLLFFVSSLAGLESMKRLQRLSVDHNQLISTKGLRDVYTLIHLDCSHNHLASVEGLENSALLQTLDLRANSLTEVKTATADHGYGT